jgi:site-specific DNA recombinase
MNLEYFKKFSSPIELEKNSNSKVWSYTRVSSKAQSDENGSLETQSSTAKNFADEFDYELVHEFGNTYESASGDMTRSEFKSLINQVKTSKCKPFAILIYKVNRFSRTGGSAVALLHELIYTHGVHLIEVISGLDTTTEIGEYEIMKLLLDAKKENMSRLEFTIPGMIKFLKKGNWLGKAPRGYNHYGKKVTNDEFYARNQKLEINNEGHLLKKAWRWKSQEIPDYKIREKLETLGLKISKQSLSQMWRKPFYCGINTNNLLKGEVVTGKWKPLVSVRDFKAINDRLEGNTNTGYTKSKICEDRPLQSDLYCGNCTTKMTGYKAKRKYDYYKCQNKSCSTKDMNAKSSKKSLRTGLNDLFEDYLSQFCMSRNYVEVFKAQMKLTLEDKNKESIEIEPLLNKQLKELESQKDKLDRKHAFDDLKPELYKKYSVEIDDKIEAIKTEKSKLGISISNLDKKLEKCIEVTQNISKYWKHGSVENKMRVQKLIFPSGIVIDPKNREYRTTEINSVFSIIVSISRDAKSSKKTKVSKNADLSSLVAGTEILLR